MADYKSFPNEYAERVTLTSTGYGMGFGFNAAHIRIRNLGPKTAYLSLQSTSGASTGSYQLSSGDDVQFQNFGVGVAGCSFAATSSGGVVDVGAWG